MVARKTAGNSMGAATVIRSAAARAAARVSTDDTQTAHDQGLGKSPLDTAALKRAREHVAKYAAQDNAKGACVVGLTLALWVATLLIGVWWFRRAPLTTLWGLAGTACWAFFRVGSYVRAFVVMHDAIHNALFTKRWMNTAAAIVTGLVNGADAPDYQKTHGQHHALLGREDELDPDLIVLWTTKDWAAWPRGLSKAAARVMCDPLVMFTVFAPVWIIAFNVAWPQRVAHHTAKQRVAYVIAKLVALPCLYAALMFVTGTTRTHLLAELLVQQCAMSYAMFLFCVEHTFEGVYRAPKEDYNRTAAGLLGSSFLSVPWWWRFATCSIEYHHIHHLNARVACYNLKACQDEAPPGMWEEVGVRMLTARDGFRALVLSMWDPDQRCYVPFPEWAWLDRLLAPTTQQPEQLQQPAKKVL